MYRARSPVSVTPQNEIIFQETWGFDITVSSTKVILEHIQEEVSAHPLTHLLSIRDKGLEVVEVRVSADSKAIGTAVQDLVLPPGTKLALIIPATQKPRMPMSDTVIQADDRGDCHHQRRIRRRPQTCSR